MNAPSTVDLLTLTEPSPPLGGLGYRNATGVTHALWSPHPEVVGERTVHARTVRLAEPTALHRLIVRPGRGYHKCGSEDQWDWVTAFRLRVRGEDGWRTEIEMTELPAPVSAAAEPLSIDLGGVVVDAATIEVLGSGLDGPWTPWNLAEDAFQLFGDAPVEPATAEMRLTEAGIDLTGLPAGVEARLLRGEVRFTAATYEVGFSLGRAAFSYLALDDEGRGRVDRDLLLHRPGVDQSGVMLHPVGHAAVASPARHWRVLGDVRVRGNVVRYDLEMPDAGQRLELQWSMQPDRIVLEAVRTGETDVEAWESAAWQVGFDPSVAAVATLGSLVRRGRTGLLELPVVLHAPGHGALVTSSDTSEVTWRSDADRESGWLLGQMKLGESPTPRGTSLLRAGRFAATVEFAARAVGVEATADAPAEGARALQRVALTGLSYRADTGTFSNNSVSIHCPMSMDTWSALARGCGEVVPGVDTQRMMRDSLERWLDGGPGYASGTMRDGAGLRPAEDEYLISGVGTLLGLAEYLREAGDPEWVRGYAGKIDDKLTALAARDVDDDGLIESPYRRGVSGEYDWSTNWYDVVSFGWKDAYVNAMLFQALTSLEETLPALGAAQLTEGMGEWRRRIAAAFVSTFVNPDTGWVAGWRCAEDRLHDYAFLAVNAIVVNSGVLPRERERPIIEALWREYRDRCAAPARWGLPNNLWPIPDADLTRPMHGYPHGFYLNGALSHSQSRHFVSALYRVGLTDEAESLLRELCASLGDGSAFGGSQTGVDWRQWDGAACGYEGLLTEQFGIMAVAIDRYGAPSGVGA